MILAEYTIAPNWYFTLSDEYNYASSFMKDLNISRDIHYPGAAVTYVRDAVRVMLGYGRQRKGIVCVGGVCREVPASNGFFLSITASF